MQRGLRMNPTSKQLWQEYFKLELVYVEKIKVRRKILGIESSDITVTVPDEAMEQPKEENIIKLSNLYEHEMPTEQSDSKSITTLKDDNKALKGEIAKIIFQNAIKGNYNIVDCDLCTII